MQWLDLAELLKQFIFKISIILSDILTVNYGLRYDSFEMDDGPAYNEYGSGLLGFRNDTPASTSILQPRFGFQLDASDMGMFTF